MADKLLREVQFIDGVQEFLEEGYIVELLAKDQNSFVLSGLGSPHPFQYIIIRMIITR